MEIRADLDAKIWDFYLAECGGHPLQSALWGDARRETYGIFDQRVAIYENNRLLCLIRIEKRGRCFFQVAWIPQGPTLTPVSNWLEIKKYCEIWLSQTYQASCMTHPWEAVLPHNKKRKTIWIDLRVGKDNLWKNLDKQWRYGVRFAERCGVSGYIASSLDDLAAFHRLCHTVAKIKNFNFSPTQQFLSHLLNQSRAQVMEAKLFLVKHENQIGAGAFIMRVGQHVHYMFGGVDRAFSKQRVGEYVQWMVIEWAIAQGCVRYDLEGIDEVENASVAAFKKKLGGEIVALPAPEIKVFDWRGGLIRRAIAKKALC